MAASQFWCFNVKNGVLHSFNRPVYDVIPSQTQDNVVKIYLENDKASGTETVYRCPVESFVNGSSYFEALEQCSSGKEFRKILFDLMYKFKISLCSEIEDQSSSDDEVVPKPTKSAKKRKHFHHHLTFEEEVEVLRGLHPMAGQSVDTLLDTKDTSWRRKAENAMRYDKDSSDTNFGGLFREQIFVATLSDRCYQVAKDIMERYANKTLKDQKNKKVNRSLFTGFVAMKEENIIHDFFVQLRDGKLSKDEANDRALKYKAQLKENSDVRQRKSQNTLRMQVLTLRLENDRLKEELEKVEKENEILKKDMQMLRENVAMEETTEDRTDTFADPFVFQEEEYIPQLSNFTIKAVIHHPDQQETDENYEMNVIENGMSPISDNRLHIEEEQQRQETDENFEMYIIENGMSPISDNRPHIEEEQQATEKDSAIDTEEELLKTFKIIEDLNDSQQQSSNITQGGEENGEETSIITVQEESKKSTQKAKKNKVVKNKVVQEESKKSTQKATKNKVVQEESKKSTQKATKNKVVQESKKSKEKAKKIQFKLNDRVKAKWTDRKFYNGRIIKITGEKFLVKFYDGYEKTVTERDMKRV